MRKIWFTSDTHFGHQRSLELLKRPFKNLDDMNKTMILNWNSVVGENDIVYHLGDFGEYEISNYLNGKIDLLYGNYERDNIEKGLITLKELKNNFNFTNINSRDSYTINIDDIILNIVHEPSKMDKDKFNLFGHIHKLQMVKRNGLNVGVDCHNFTPIDLETVLFYKNSIENIYDNEVFF